MPVIMHRRAPAPHVDIHVEDGQMISIGHIKLRVFHTPGHTPDSISLYTANHVFTGDTILIHGLDGQTSQVAVPQSNTTQSFISCLLCQDETLVFPAHDYRGHTHSTDR